MHNDYGQNSYHSDGAKHPKNLAGGQEILHFVQDDGGAGCQAGRSMVEMLGTLAIVGVLSAGAIGGYSYAMNKHRTNELIYEATKRAQWVGTQLEMNNPNPSLNTFGTDSFGFGSFSGIDNNLPNANQFGIQVSDLNKSVCDNLVNHLERTGVVRDVTNVDCNAGTATLVFNRDLSTSDSEITPDEPEVSGEVSAQASTEAPTTQDPDEVHCNGNGSWNGSSCYCDNGWQGDNCSEEEPESSEPATINNEPEETISRSDAECNYHGEWGGVGYCLCNKGWSADDCSVEQDVCSGHGRWESPGCGSRCLCDSGWGGSDCSKCSGHGGWRQSLNNGAGGCECNGNWGGSDCSEDKSNACSGHGTWYGYLNNYAGGCSCESGWGGGDCSKCSGHGSWNGSTCSCNSNWGGSDCSEDHTNDCGEHGEWCGSGCNCNTGWGGSDCSIENPCSGHGTWNSNNNNGAGGCSCQSGWEGDDCSGGPNALYCNGHGLWIVVTGSSYPSGGYCSCDSAWGGSDCSISTSCSGHGTWGVYGEQRCWCNSGWGGSDCSESSGSPATITAGYNPVVTTTRGGN